MANTKTCALVFLMADGTIGLQQAPEIMGPLPRYFGPNLRAVECLLEKAQSKFSDVRVFIDTKWMSHEMTLEDVCSEFSNYPALSKCIKYRFALQAPQQLEHTVCEILRRFRTARWVFISAFDFFQDNEYRANFEHNWVKVAPLKPTGEGGFCDDDIGRCGPVLLSGLVAGLSLRRNTQNTKERQELVLKLWSSFDAMIPLFEEMESLMLDTDLKTEEERQFDVDSVARIKQHMEEMQHNQEQVMEGLNRMFAMAWPAELARIGQAVKALELEKKQANEF
jgi:hypothetical protein